MQMSFHDLATNPILIIVLGIALIYLGYGPLSRKKNPTAGVAFVIVGFLCRVAGPMLALLLVPVLIYIISMIQPVTHR